MIMDSDNSLFPAVNSEHKNNNS